MSLSALPPKKERKAILTTQQSECVWEQTWEKSQPHIWQLPTVAAGGLWDKVGRRQQPCSWTHALFPAPSSCCLLPATALHLSTLPSGESNFENSFFLFSLPYLTLVCCYKDPWALRCFHGQLVPKLCVSSPPVGCFISGSYYGI